jgi:hypothetical protein
MRSLVKRLEKEKLSIEQCLIDKPKTGISVNELKEKERKLNRIEKILSGVKGSVSKYMSIARIESLKRKEKREKAIM